MSLSELFRFIKVVSLRIWSKILKKDFSLGFLRTTILPLIIVSLFGLALLAVTARIWLPGDMLAPAPLG